MLRMRHPYQLPVLIATTSFFLFSFTCQIPASGQTAYFSLQGDVVAVGDQLDIFLDLTRSVGSAEDLRFVTYTHSGGTNAAGDVITASAFDSDLSLYDSSIALRGQDDQSGPGLDALLSWPGVQLQDTPLNPDPLSAGMYRLYLQEYQNNNTGAWAVDLIGPADAIAFTGAVPSSSGTIDSLKFGTTGGGTAVYNHQAGTLDLLGGLVVAATGSAELNLTGGTVTAGGMTTVNTGGTLDIDGGTLNADSHIYVNGGTFNRTSGSLNLATGNILSAANNGQVSFTGGMNIAGGTIYGMNSGADLSSTSYIDIGGNSDGTLIVDGSGSSMTTGTASNFWGYGGATADVTIRDQATANISGLNLRIGYGTTAGSTGILSVESDADVTINSNIHLSDAGAIGGSGSITVTGLGSTLEQTGAYSLTVGHASAGVGTITVDYSGTFTTATGTTTINPTGTININGGTYNARGDILVDGGTFNRAGGIFNLETGKILTASNNGQVLFSSSYNINDGTTFIIDSGADLSGTSFIDVGNMSEGTLIVDGPGSSFTTNAISYFGANGGSASVTIRNEASATFNNPIRVVEGSVAGTTGAFTIESDADVTIDSDMTIASGGPVGGSGTITITGAGSTLTQNGTGTLVVGNASQGAGTLVITDSGHFMTGTGTTTINATGLIDVDGGFFYPKGNVVVDGGMLRRTSGSIFGVAAGKTLTALNGGTVELHGAHSIAGDSTYTINSGSQLTGTSYIDVGNGSNGTLIVDGPGSYLSVGSYSYWGADGALADITIRNQATADIMSLDLAQGVIAGTTCLLRIESGAEVTAQGDVFIAVGGPTASGATMTVTGPGSTFQQLYATNLQIGHSTTGAAVLFVEDSGRYTIGTGTTYINNTGVVEVNTGGAFNSLGTININGGRLELNDGSIITGSLANNTGTLVHNDGTLTVSGGTFNPSTADYTINGPTSVEQPTLVLEYGATAPGMNGEMWVASTHQGRLELLNGASLTSSTAYIGHDSAAKGQVLVDGLGTVWTVSSNDLRVGRTGLGQLTVSNDAIVTVGDDFALGQLTGGKGTVYITSGAAVTVSSRTFIAEQGTGSLTINTGGLLTSNADVWTGESAAADSTISVLGNGSQLDAKSDMYIGGGPSSANGEADLNIAAGASVKVANELRIWDQGAVNFSGGTLQADTIRNIDGGTFKFTGGQLHVSTFDGNLQNYGGTVAPGNSLGSTKITGDYDQQYGSLAIELAGSGGVSGVDYDRLDVFGNLTLDAALEVSLFHGFTPSIGDSFTIVKFGGIRTGTFSDVLMPMGLGVGLQIQYNTGDITLRALLAGDLNADGFVGIEDLNIVLGNWNANVTAGIWSLGDPTGDGFIGIEDLNVVLGNWNAGTPPTATTIPEPTTAVIILSLSTLLTRRKR